ncbi:hypothetical protein P4117_09720 [Pseudomonas aeruginosa]|nr:hypothetical protein [Pseudomonas aeruginosa]
MPFLRIIPSPEFFEEKKAKEYMYLACQKSLVNACSGGKKVIIPYRHVLEPFLLFFRNYGMDQLFSDGDNAKELNQKLSAIRQEKNNKQESLNRISNEIEKNSGEISRTILALITKIESQISALNDEEHKILAQIESAKNSELIRKEITRDQIDKVLETEEGRMKFNTLLTEKNIGIYVGRKVMPNIRACIYSSTTRDSQRTSGSIEKKPSSH